jgi:phosphoribosyl 1,2-cyclic phosphate phosphodiesterase
MRAQFLGTAASEGYPDPFCDCANCRQARELGGPNLRKRSALLIDGELLIDLGPDLLAASQLHGIPLTRLRYCLQTHEHQDHLHTDFFLARSPFCGVHDGPTLDFYGTAGALARIRGEGSHFARLGEEEASASLRLNLHEVAPFQTFTVGPYRVSTLLAAHDPALVPLSTSSSVTGTASSMRPIPASSRRRPGRRCARGAGDSMSWSWITPSGPVQLPAAI